MRIAILEQIAVKDDCIQKELVEVMGLAPTTVLSHLQALKKAGLLKGSVSSGSKLCYCIDWQTLNDFKINLGNLHEKITLHHTKVFENKGKCM
ncbi:winged helix-turn-helix domain-containing protein [Flavobacterium limnosediminis]